VLRVGHAALARLSADGGTAYVLAPLRVATARGCCARAWIAPTCRAAAQRGWP